MNVNAKRLHKSTILIAVLLAALLSFSPIASTPAHGNTLPVMDRNAILDAAETVANLEPHVPYLFGGIRAKTFSELVNSSGTDCSGYVYYAYQQSGITLDEYGTSTDQIIKMFVRLGENDVVHEGDLIFWGATNATEIPPTAKDRTYVAEWQDPDDESVWWDVRHVAIYAGPGLTYEAGSQDGLHQGVDRETSDGVEPRIGYFRISAEYATGQGEYFGRPDSRYPSGTWLVTDDDGVHNDGEGGAIYLVVGGAKFYISHSEFLAIDWTDWGLSGPPPLTHKPWVAISDLRDVPRDGTFLRDPETMIIYEVIGNAKVEIADWDEYLLLDPSGTAYANVPAQILDLFSSEDAPTGDRLLRDPVSMAVYQVANGERLQLTMTQWKDMGYPRYTNVPFRMIDRIPEGVPTGPTFVRDDDGVTYQVLGGTRFELTDDEYLALHSPDWVPLSDEILNQIPFGLPDAQVLYKDVLGPEVYQIVGDRRIQLNQGEFNALAAIGALGAPGYVEVPLRFITEQTTEGAPTVEYLRDPLTEYVYRVIEGEKYRLTWTEYDNLGQPDYVEAVFRFINMVPDGVPFGPTFVRDAVTGNIYQVLGGAKYLLTPDEYGDLESPPYVNTPMSTISQIGDGVPQGYDLLQPAGSDWVFQVRDGKVYLLTQLEFNNLPSHEYVILPMGFINRYPHGTPVGSAYVRRAGTPYIYELLDGLKYQLNYAEYISLGSPAFYDMPSASLDQIPTASVETGGPVNVTLLLDPTTGIVYQVVDGEKFRLTLAEYNALPSHDYVKAPFTFINLIPDGVPTGPTFVRNASTGAIYQVLDGQKYALTSTEFASLGSPTWVNTPATVISQIPTASVETGGPSNIPLLLDPATGIVYQVVDGEKFRLTQTEYNALPSQDYVKAPFGFINLIPDGVPTGPTFVRQAGTTTIYQILDGLRYTLSLPEYQALGSPAFVDTPLSVINQIPIASIETGGPVNVPLLLDPATGIVYQVANGEKIRLTQTEYNALPSQDYVKAPFPFINLIPDGVPTGPTFVRNETTQVIYQVLGGVKYPIASMAELQTLGNVSWVNTPVAVIDQIPEGAPWGEYFLKDPATGNVYQVLGDAKYLLSDDDETAMGPLDTVLAPKGFIDQATGVVPLGPIVVYATGSVDLFLIADGVKSPLTFADAQAVLGAPTYEIPAGWLALIPDAT